MRAEKQLLLDEVKEKIDASKGFVIANYKGMSAQKARAFRDTVASANGDFEIVRKRVFAKAAEKIGIKLDADSLKGHVGILFAKEDAIALSKVAVEFSDKNDKTFELLGGMIDGAYCSGAEVQALASLPSLNELRGQFIGTLQASLTSLLYCLEEKSKQEEKA